MKRISSFFRSVIFIVAGGSLLTLPSNAQHVLLQNAQAFPEVLDRAADRPHLEIESIEIHAGLAIPSQIHRPAGKFVLLLVNRTLAVPASFVLDPADVGEGIIGPHPLLTLSNLGAASQKHRAAALADLPAGQYHLKAQDSGKILCRITID